MRLTHFFIDRPRFATVLSIFVTVLGLGALAILPIAQYPEIVPPTVQVAASYPGASAETVARTVATPLEQQINGVENMLYMSSQSTGDGNLTVTVTACWVGATPDKWGFRSLQSELRPILFRLRDLDASTRSRSHRCARGVCGADRRCRRGVLKDGDRFHPRAGPRDTSSTSFNFRLARRWTGPRRSSGTVSRLF
jgi:AcrB/AcrD/AcrF family